MLNDVLEEKELVIPYGQADKWKGPKGNEGGVVVKSELQKNGDVKVWYNNQNTHNLIIGMTGSGKTQSYILPSILSIGNSDGSLVINDPKGELYSLTSEYLKSQGYKVYAFDYFEPGAGTCFNQMSLVNNEYDKGLPHFYYSKAIESLLRAIELIESSGEVNNFKYFQIKTMVGTKSAQPRFIQKDLVKGRYVEQRQDVGEFSRGVRGGSQVTMALINEKAPELTNKDALSSLYKMVLSDSVKELVSFLHELYAHVYSDIQKNYKVEKTGAIDDCKHNNEYLRVREERVCQAAIDMLSIISLPNVKKYYTAKINQNEFVLSKEQEGTSAFLDVTEKLGDYRTMMEKLEKDGLTVESLKQFLKDNKADHDIVWLDCETNAANLAGAIGQILVGEASKNADPFWNSTAKSLIKGLVMLVSRESHIDHSRHLGSLARIVALLTTAKSNSSTTELDDIISRFEEYDPIRNSGFSTILMAADKTKSSIYASASDSTVIFGNYNVVDQSAYNDFDPTMLAKEKTAVFLISPGSDDVGSAQYTVLSTLFIEQVYSALTRYLTDDEDLTLPRPVYMLLDELCNIPVLPALGSKVTLARSKKIRFSIVIQDFNQLKDKYEDAYNTIKANSEVIYLLTNSYETAKEISDKLGDATIETNSFSQQSNNMGRDSMSISTQSSGRKLFTPEEIMAMPMGSGLYMMAHGLNYQTSLEMAYKWPIYKWLQSHKLRNIHVRRNPRPTNFFCPDSEDYTFAYESLYRGVAIDGYVYENLSHIKNPETPVQKDKEKEEENKGKGSFEMNERGDEGSSPIQNSGMIYDEDTGQYRTI